MRARVAECNLARKSTKRHENVDGSARVQLGVSGRVVVEHAGVGQKCGVEEVWFVRAR